MSNKRPMRPILWLLVRVVMSYSHRTCNFVTTLANEANCAAYLVQRIGLPDGQVVANFDTVLRKVDVGKICGADTGGDIGVLNLGYGFWIFKDLPVKVGAKQGQPVGR